MEEWQQYQEDAAKYFRSIGLKASTDINVQGVRTSHDVDVLVLSHHVGFEITWIVECKYWKSSVNKLHVLGLREIIADIGADRGILLSESGFQSGAIEAANLTNIQLSSLANLRENSSHGIYAMRLRDLYDRVNFCKDRYWEIPKSKRIEYNFRTDLFEDGYSGSSIIAMCIDLLTRAFRGVYPFKSEDVGAFIIFGKDKNFESQEEVIKIVESNVLELEDKLNFYDSKEKGVSFSFESNNSETKIGKQIR